METVTTLVLWGAPSSSWCDWMQYMVDSGEFLGSPLTHFGVKGEGLGVKTIRPIDVYERMQVKIVNTEIDWLTGYALPEGFQTAVFDYELHLSRSNHYASVAVKDRFAGQLVDNQDAWLADLSEHCEFDRGALFTVNSDESPMLVVSGAASGNDISSFTLIKEF